MRKLTLAFVTVASLPNAARAQDIPCPTEQIIQQVRTKNDARSKPHGEDFYKQLRENYDEQCSTAKRALADLKPKLKEYEDGKRSDRDGYIILRKLTWQYQVLRAESQPEARAATLKMQALEKKNPKFIDIQDEKLTEDRSAEKKRADAVVAKRDAAQRWVPPDADPISEYTKGDIRIVAYQYRIEFFSGDANTRVKTLRFKHRIITAPDSENWAHDSEGNLLVCTRQDAGYSPRSEDEAAMIRQGGHGRTMPWINPTADVGAFCGILDSSGRIVFEFPAMSFPSRVYVPLGLVNAGRKAAVKVGSFVRNMPIEGDDDSRTDSVTDFKQVLVWEYPNHVRTVPISKDDLWGNRLIKRLRDGKL